MKTQPQFAKNFHSFQSYLQSIHDTTFKSFKYRTLQYDTHFLKTEDNFEEVFELISSCLSRSDGYRHRTAYQEDFHKIRRTISRYYYDYPDIGGCLFADSPSNYYTQENLAWLAAPSVEYLTGDRSQEYLLILWKRIDSIVTFHLFYGTVALNVAYGTLDSPFRFIEPTLATALMGNLSIYKTYSPFTFKYNDWFEIIEPTVEDFHTVASELSSRYIYQEVGKTRLPFFVFVAPEQEASPTTPISTLAFVKIRHPSNRIAKLPKYLPLFYPSLNSARLMRNTENFLSLSAINDPSVLHKSVTLLKVFKHINSGDIKYLEDCVKATIRTYSKYLMDERQDSVLASKALDLMLRNYPEDKILANLTELKLAE